MKRFLISTFLGVASIACIAFADEDTGPAKDLQDVVMTDSPALDTKCPVDVTDHPGIEGFRASNVSAQTEARATDSRPAAANGIRSISNRSTAKGKKNAIRQGRTALQPASPLSDFNSLWPPPVGSTHLSPRAVDFRPTQPYWPTPNFPVTKPSAVASEAPADEGGEFYPDGRTVRPPHYPPLPLRPETTPYAPPVISTALPCEYHVPMSVPTGPSTGHRSTTRPWRVAELPNLAPPPHHANIPYPVGGIAPEETFSINNASCSGLGMGHYFRFIDGGYGQTDLDGQRQIFILGAQDAGLAPTPLP